MSTGPAPGIDWGGGLFFLNVLITFTYLAEGWGMWQSENNPWESVLL